MSLKINDAVVSGVIRRRAMGGAHSVRHQRPEHRRSKASCGASHAGHPLSAEAPEMHRYLDLGIRQRAPAPLVGVYLIRPVQGALRSESLRRSNCRGAFSGPFIRCAAPLNIAAPAHPAPAAYDRQGWRKCRKCRSIFRSVHPEHKKASPFARRG